jgi:hypothetical protein
MIPIQSDGHTAPGDLASKDIEIVQDTRPGFRHAPSLITTGAGAVRATGAEAGWHRAVGASQQGNSVAPSADGNTAITGGYADNSFTRTAWV